LTTDNQGADNTVRRLLELVSAAVVTLCNSNLHAGAMKIARALETAAAGDETNARLIQIRAYQLKAEIYEDSGNDTEAIRVFKESLAILNPSETEYATETLGLIRALFRTGQHRHGFRVLAHAVLTSLRHAVDQSTLYDYLLMTRFGDLQEAISVEDFRKALVAYGTAFLDVETSQMTSLLDTSLQKAVEFVLERKPESP